MALELAKNLQVATVLTPPSPATSGTSLVVDSGLGARFDTPPFNAYVVPSNARPTKDNAEVVRVSNISTDTFTIARAQESSTARTIVAGDLIFVGPTAKTFTDIQTALDARQPLDSDLTAIAALTTTSFGRSVLALADAAAGQTLFSAQPSDSDLTAIAALTTTSFGRSLLTQADAAATLSTIGAQPSDSDLTSIAALSTTSYGRSLLESADAAALRTLASVYSTAQVDFIVTAFTSLPAAKGDIFTASANDTPAVLPVGSNGLVPIYDSGQSVGLRTGAPLAAPKIGIEIARMVGVIGAGQASGTFGFNLGAALGSGSVASQPQGVVDIASAELAVTGLTPKLKTKLIVETNPTAPAITFTGGLSLLSAPTGGANTLTTAWGAVVTSPDTRAAVASPAATSYVSTLSSSYALPSDGRYVLTVTTTQNMAATNPRVNVWCILYLLYE